jgi:GNAT superfamily N-acetyltransferase
MHQMDSRPPLRIRDFVPPDQPAVVDLLGRVLDRPGEGRHDAAYFAWKHLENPYGPSLMLVAEAEGQIVGFRAFMMWHLDAGGTQVRAGRPVDTVTDPSWRRLGVFSRLTKTALARVEELGISVLFNTPNEQSLPGYLRMGWTPLGRARRDVLVAGPGIFLKSFWSRIRADGARPDSGTGPGEEGTIAWGPFADALAAPPGVPVRVIKDRSYVIWRYSRHPWHRYRLIQVPGASAAVRVVSRRGIRIAIVGDNTARNEGEWQELLAQIAAETGAPVIQVLRTAPPTSRQVRGWRRFERTGPMLVVRSERPEIANLEAWSLTTGELEFF